jgi:hypothetical protein
MLSRSVSMFLGGTVMPTRLRREGMPPMFDRGAANAIRTDGACR